MLCQKEGTVCMFCMNCGEKLVEGAKFCSNCGTNLSKMVGVENIILPLANNVVKGDNTNVFNLMEIKEEVIENIFSENFHIRGEFGKHVFIAGKDRLEYEYDLKEHFLSGNSEEKLLMIFEYVDNYKNKGFIITNQRIAWDYGWGISEILLTDIKNVTIGKAYLATIRN